MSRHVKSHLIQVTGIPTYRRLATTSRLPLLDSKKPFLDLILSYENGGHHFFGRPGELVSKYVHQGDRKYTCTSTRIFNMLLD